MSVDKPLVVAAGRDIRLQMMVQRNEAAATLQAFTLTDVEHAEAIAWTHHLVGTIRPGRQHIDKLPLTEILERCSQDVSLHEAAGAEVFEAASIVSCRRGPQQEVVAEVRVQESATTQFDAASQVQSQP